MSRLDKIRELVLENITEGKDVGICHIREGETNPMIKEVICSSDKLGTYSKLDHTFTSPLRCTNCPLHHKIIWFRFEEETFYGFPPE